MKTMTFGLLVCAGLSVALWCLLRKRPVGALVGGGIAMILTCLTGCSWREMLIDSGKETALLGFQRYPAVLVILVILFLCGLITMVSGAVSLTRRRN